MYILLRGVQLGMNFARGPHNQYGILLYTEDKVTVKHNFIRVTLLNIYARL